MNLPSIVLSILQRINAAGFTAYVVGGCVRNYFLGMDLGDIDFCTNADPNAIASIFPEYKVDLHHQKFGTAFLYIGNTEYQITRFRKEALYKDARHPSEIQFVETFEEDAPRRDFTINAIAYHPSIGFLDYFEGISDLSRRQLRFIGEAKVRIQEDYLRILRAIRFMARYPLQLDSAGRKALLESLHYIAVIAPSTAYKEYIASIQGEFLQQVINDYPLYFFYFFRDINWLSQRAQERSYANKLAAYCTALRKDLNLLPFSVFIDAASLDVTTKNKLRSFGITKTAIEKFDALLKIKSIILQHWTEKTALSFIKKMRLLALKSEMESLNKAITLCHIILECNAKEALKDFQNEIQDFKDSIIQNPLPKISTLAMTAKQIAQSMEDTKQYIKILLQEICVAIENGNLDNTKSAIGAFIKKWKQENIKKSMDFL